MKQSQNASIGIRRGPARLRKIASWLVFSGVIFLVAGLLNAALRLPLWAAPQSFGEINLTEVAPRIITPNGDLQNDVAYFRFDGSLAGLPIDTSVLDVNGAKIASLKLDSSETNLLWDGKDESGRALPSGIYIYQISIGNHRATGTLAIAR